MFDKIFAMSIPAAAVDQDHLVAFLRNLRDLDFRMFAAAVERHLVALVQINGVRTEIGEGLPSLSSTTNRREKTAVTEFRNRLSLVVVFHGKCPLKDMVARDIHWSDWAAAQV